MNLMEKIRSRTEEDGDCLIYRAGNPRVPQVTFDGIKVNVRRLILEEAGIPLIKGALLGCSCLTPNCIALDHIRQRTRLQHGQFFAKRGAYSGVAKTAKMAATKRAKSKLDDEKVRAIRESTKSSMALSAEYGVAASYITSIKAGLLWKNYSSPFAGLGAR